MNPDICKKCKFKTYPFYKERMIYNDELDDFISKNNNEKEGQLVCYKANDYHRYVANLNHKQILYFESKNIKCYNDINDYENQDKNILSSIKINNQCPYYFEHELYDLNNKEIK